MLELKNISYKVDNKTILDNINLKFDYGKIIAITGHNGSGKSTLVKLIMGIINQTSGDLVLDGENINNLNITKRAKLGIGFTFQQPVKFKGLTVSNLLETAVGGELNIKCGCDYLSKVGLCAKQTLYKKWNEIADMAFDIYMDVITKNEQMPITKGKENMREALNHHRKRVKKGRKNTKFVKKARIKIAKRQLKETKK